MQRLSLWRLRLSSALCGVGEDKWKEFHDRADKVGKPSEAKFVNHPLEKFGITFNVDFREPFIPMELCAFPTADPDDPRGDAAIYELGAALYKAVTREGEGEAVSGKDAMSAFEVAGRKLSGGSLVCVGDYVANSEPDPRIKAAKLKACKRFQLQLIKGANGKYRVDGAFLHQLLAGENARTGGVYEAKRTKGQANATPQSCAYAIYGLCHEFDVKNPPTTKQTVSLITVVGTTLSGSELTLHPPVDKVGGYTLTVSVVKQVELTAEPTDKVIEVLRWLMMRLLVLQPPDPTVTPALSPEVVAKVDGSLALVYKVCVQRAVVSGWQAQWTDQTEGGWGRSWLLARFCGRRSA